MPIYEFKCLECGYLQEIIVTSSSQEFEIKCEKCNNSHLQRVLSRTSYIMGDGKSTSVKSTTKQCGPSDSCTTYEIPGYQK